MTVQSFTTIGDQHDGCTESSFDIARAYYDQRTAIAADADILQALIAAIQAEYDLTPPQWAQWYSVALAFQPDLIVELGRGQGNSTAVFCQAASRLGRTRVVSLCNSTTWAEASLPRVRPLVPAGWLDRLDARVTDILDVDYDHLLTGAGRVLLLWDAHGFEIAETVLGRILPLLAGHPHLVLMHDISDSRYADVPRSYDGQPLWKGSTWDKGMGPSAARVNIGWMNSLQDQVVAISDFSVRNDVEIGSGDHAYATFFGRHGEYAAEMRELLGDRFFSPTAHWAFFSLMGKEAPLYFPALARRFRYRSDVRVRDIHPARWLSRSGDRLRLVRTSGVPWAYAAVLACRPGTDIPPDARLSLRLRVRVDGAPIGIGLLNADRSAFLESRRILPSTGAGSVFLPVADRATAGPLVVHTWDVPRKAIVRIEDISFVW